MVITSLFEHKTGELNLLNAMYFTHILSLITSRIDNGINDLLSFPRKRESSVVGNGGLDSRVKPENDILNKSPYILTLCER
jgi:hypothetical protein